MELLNFTYQKENKNKPNTNELLYQSCKLKTIVSPGTGSIDIDYHYDAVLEGTMNDPYSITKVSLKNTHSAIISQYGLIYSDGLNQGYTRKLIKINKINLSNPTGAPLETTKLLYTSYSLENALGGDIACTATPSDNQ